jgi:hypothetical protein
VVSLAPQVKIACSVRSPRQVPAIDIDRKPALYKHLIEALINKRKLKEL